jgi:hypothetical protein
VVVIYPDGTKITKNGPYELTTGKLTRDQITEILESLKDAGFFEFKEEYGAGQAKAGGSTQTLTVVLEGGTYKVSVTGGAGPAGWSGIVDTVTGAKASAEKDFVPSSVILYSKEESQVPEGAAVAPWPGQASDLAGAAAQDGKRLEGESAASAWKALQGVYAEGGPGSDAYWTVGGKTYTYVYARPELPGVEQ